MHFKNKQFSLPLRTSGKSRDSPPTAQNRHVSLANIATAFLTERKTSSRRQTSGRRKKRLTIKESQASNGRRSTNYSSATTSSVFINPMSMQSVGGSISTIFMTHTSSTAGVNNKHRTTLVMKICFFNRFIN